MALLHVDFFSDVLGMCVEMDVILPQREGGRESGGYKTLYLLHGMSDDHTIWQRRTSIERYADEKGLAVVMPSTQLGWYTDMRAGFKWWTYISDELPKIARAMFPGMSARREDTFAAGLSMGGYGALKLGLKKSDTFSRVAALSGALDVADIVERNPNDTYWTDIFGPADGVRASENDLFKAAEDLKASGGPLPGVFIWCGTEDSLITANARMRDALNKLGYDVTYSQSPGDHQWKYWDEQIQNVLNWLPLGKEDE